MSLSSGPRRPGGRTMIVAGAALAVTTVAGALVEKHARSAMATACVYAAGTLAVAWLTARLTEYPRWAWFSAAGLLALTCLAAAVRFPEPSQVKDWSGTVWMLPWLFLVMAGTPSRARGACSPQSRWGGPLLVGMSALFASILMGAWWLVR